MKLPIPRQGLVWLTLPGLLLPFYSRAQDQRTEIKLTVKYNARTVPNPDHIVLSTAG